MFGRFGLGSMEHTPRGLLAYLEPLVPKRGGDRVDH
jgi:hypothetical protein